MIRRANPYFSGRIDILGAEDDYSISGDSVHHSAAAIVFLGDGSLVGGLQTDRDKMMIIVPSFAESGERGCAVWWKKGRGELKRKTSLGLFEWSKQERQGIADALDSVRLEAPERIAKGVNLEVEARELAKEFRRKAIGEEAEEG